MGKGFVLRSRLPERGINRPNLQACSQSQLIRAIKRFWLCVLDWLGARSIQPRPWTRIFTNSLPRGSTVHLINATRSTGSGKHRPSLYPGAPSAFAQNVFDMIQIRSQLGSAGSRGGKMVPVMLE